MEDKQIIELYNQRKETAIEQTAEKYGSYCFSIANNILHSHEDSEECVNDTWLKAWNAIPPTVPKYLRIFLGKITRNLSFDKYRAIHSESRGGGQFSVVLDELEEIVAGSQNVESQYEQKELVEAINKYLKRLPERDCNIFIRRYFYAEETSCIARRYEIKESNVLMILSRTRKKLHTFLKEEDFI
ncbi:MAG: sigma-70 family RNA polymerase sigma factor [Lachnospiraceae bacterium]|nr:sigma-70 family RNA polymerase sigma factor [Lachnospiraceae bacterium]